MLYEVEYQYDEGMLPEEHSVKVCQLHAELDLWATRLNMAKASHKLAESVVYEIEKWDCSIKHLDDATDRAMRWLKAVKKINAKYEKVKDVYANCFFLGEDKL